MRLKPVLRMKLETNLPEYFLA